MNNYLRSDIVKIVKAKSNGAHSFTSQLQRHQISDLRSGMLSSPIDLDAWSADYHCLELDLVHVREDSYDEQVHA